MNWGCSYECLTQRIELIDVIFDKLITLGLILLSVLWQPPNQSRTRQKLRERWELSALTSFIVLTHRSDCIAADCTTATEPASEEKQAVR